MTPPDYRDRLTTGIVHFGPGAFHRAHQADYIDLLIRQDPRWGIAAVSLRSGGTIEALRRQDGCYTLAILDEVTSFRKIGVHTRFYGPEDSGAARRQLADPAIHLVSSTVTEKGYCLRGDGTLDFDHPDIIQDLEQPDAPRGLVGWLALGLAGRRAEGLPPFTVLCCDNLASNGSKLAAAVAAFAGRINPELARWIEGEVRFPNTMVDSITPATDDRLRRLVRAETDFDDAIPVSRESYTAWVIENVLPQGTPDLASAGATLTRDVPAWERAKLRILNGAHSTIAYLGLLLGHETVADAMADDSLRDFVERLIAQDIVPTLIPSPLDLDTYTEQTLRRFRNPAIHHRLAQIAWDGSQKLPYRVLDTALDAQRHGRPIERLAVPVAAWIAFLERQFRANAEVVDPLVGRLRELAASDDPARAILQLRQVFPEELRPDSPFGKSVARVFTRLRKSDWRSLLTDATAN